MKQNVSQEVKYIVNDIISNDGRKYVYWVICCEWDSVFRDIDRIYDCCCFICFLFLFGEFFFEQECGQCYVERRCIDCDVYIIYQLWLSIYLSLSEQCCDFVDWIVYIECCYIIKNCI